MAIHQFNTTSFPFGVYAALGRVPGWTTLDRFGTNQSFTSTAIDLWETGGTRTLPTSAATVSVVSTDTADDGNPVGTGARTVLIEGLDASYAAATETVTMDGTTPVVSAASFLRINRLTVVTFGSANAAVGTITASIGGNVQAQITAGLNQSKLSQYTVPAGKTAAIVRIFANSGSGDDVRHTLQTKTVSGPWIVCRELETIATHISAELVIPILVSATGEIRIRVAKQSGGNANAGGGYSLFLIG